MTNITINNKSGIIAGAKTIARFERNVEIFNMWADGTDITIIADEFNLTRRMVRRIVKNMKKLEGAE